MIVFFLIILNSNAVFVSNMNTFDLDGSITNYISNLPQAFP